MKHGIGNTRLWAVGLGLAALFSMSNAQAATVRYILDNVVEDNGLHVTGEFYWTYDEGDFENGSGEFTELFIPGHGSDIGALTINFDAGKSIEFSLTVNQHGQGVNLTLFLQTPLSSIEPSLVDLERSKYEIEAGGLRGGFISGSIVPDLLDIDSDNDGLLLSQEDTNGNGIVDPGETDPFNPDTDGDNLTDGYEVNISGTNPLNSDTDTDGIFDDTDICPLAGDTDQLDHDNDGIGSACDNCTIIPNTDQRDTNDDGYGNLCDADVDNDGVVTRVDLLIIYRAFGGVNLDADLTGDGVVNFKDLFMARTQIGKPPGPAAL